MSRQDEIDQGLREPGGALIGGLVVLDYVQGMEDHEANVAPPRLTSASYDLGRARASEKAASKRDFWDNMQARQEATDASIRKLCADRPDVLAQYEADMAKINKRTAK